MVSFSLAHAEDSLAQAFAPFNSERGREACAQAKAAFRALRFAELKEKEQRALLNWTGELARFARAEPRAALPPVPKSFVKAHPGDAYRLEAIHSAIAELRAAFENPLPSTPTAPSFERSLAHGRADAQLGRRAATHYGTTPERWAAGRAWS